MVKQHLKIPFGCGSLSRLGVQGETLAATNQTATRLIATGKSQVENVIYCMAQSVFEKTQEKITEYIYKQLRFIQWR